MLGQTTQPFIYLSLLAINLSQTLDLEIIHQGVGFQFSTIFWLMQKTIRVKEKKERSRGKGKSIRSSVKPSDGGLVVEPVEIISSNGVREPAGLKPVYLQSGQTVSLQDTLMYTPVQVFIL